MDRILVVIIYTDFKWYVRPLYPAIFNRLSYPEKKVLFVTDKNRKGLSNLDSGDIVCAEGRAFGVNYAKYNNFDWVFFLDLDAIPDPDILQTLLKANHPFMGGTIACRGDSTQIIGHTYNNDQEKIRYPLNFRGQSGVKEVDGISGALMLVHKSIFEKVDYHGYKGVSMLPGRTTCDDEFYCIKVKEATGIKPKLSLDARAWHLHTDGFAYRWYGEKKAYTRDKYFLKFRGDTYAY